MDPMGINGHNPRLPQFNFQWLEDFHVGKKRVKLPALSEARNKKPGRILSIESWLFNRNPYNGSVLYSPYTWATWVVFHPLYTLKSTKVFFFIAQVQINTARGPGCPWHCKAQRSMPVSWCVTLSKQEGPRQMSWWTDESNEFVAKGLVGPKFEIHILEATLFKVTW